ncbi:unnamed protein product, partial [Symbiodinium necroappetens]
ATDEGSASPMWCPGSRARGLLYALLCLCLAAEPHGEAQLAGRPDRQLQVSANATISQAELERKEVEREEFSSEGEGVAYTLLSAVTFVGVTLYVVSWPDDGVRYYGWIVIGTAMSILASLLFFHKTARSLESLVFPSEASVGFRCAFYYGLFLVFFVAMQLAVGFSAGLLCADIDHEDVEFEDWVIDDPVTASHKDIVDPACIVYKRWGRAIGTDEDRHPIFLRHRNLTLEKIELRLKTIAAFLSHVTAFAAIRAGVMLQHFPFFRQNALCSLLSVLVHVAFLFLIFRVLEMVRCGGKPEKLVDLYFDEVDDVEVDVLSLSCSYMLVLCLGYAVTGEPSDFEGFQLPSTVDLKKAVIIFILGGLLFAASVALVFFWRPRYSEQSWRAKVRDMVLCTLAMAFGWCIIHAVRWTNTDLSKNRVIGFLPGSMILHVITAFVMSLLGYIVVLFLDKLEDLCLTRFGSLGRSFKSAVTATGLIIGISWETCFDKAVSIVAHGQREKQVVEPLLVVVLLLLLVPAWKRFVITKQLHFESFKFERRSQSYLKKDNDTLLPQYALHPLLPGAAQAVADALFLQPVLASCIRPGLALGSLAGKFPRSWLFACHVTLPSSWLAYTPHVFMNEKAQAALGDKLHDQVPQLAVSFGIAMASPTPLLLAAAGGFLWAFGILGKRLGVEGASNATKAVRAAITIFVYTLTTVVSPSVDLFRMGSEGWSRTWSNPDWNHRLPWIFGCGLISGAGGLLGTVAFAWSAGSSSALISMIENGTYTMSSALIIALYFREHLKPQTYIGFVFILAGVVLAQRSSRQREPVPLCDDTEESESDPEMMEKKVDGGMESEDDNSTVAPSSLRMRAVFLSVAAGTCWGFGPLGKKIGVHGSSDAEQHEWTTCTYFVYMVATTVVPLGRVLASDSGSRRMVLRDRRFRYLLLGTMFCGLISGCGGLISTFAFSLEGYFSGALIATVENGVYTVFGALLIAVLFEEELGTQQLLSACSVVLAILIFGMDFGFYLCCALRLREKQVEEAGQDSEKLLALASEVAQQDVEPFFQECRDFVSSYNEALHRRLDDTTVWREVEDGLFWHHSFEVVADEAYAALRREALPAEADWPERGDSTSIAAVSLSQDAGSASVLLEDHTNTMHIL